MIDRRKGDRRTTPPHLAKPPPGVLERRKGPRRALDRLQQELCQELEVLAKLPPSQAPAGLFEQILTRIGNYLAGSFQVGDDEVGVLLAKDQGRLLRFAYPLELYRGKLNFFPIMAPSVAGQVVRAKRGIFHNDMAAVPHLHIYERILVPGRPPRPIQKMLAVPLLDPDGRTVGVFEVSRKASTPGEAGPDFSALDLLKLTDFGGVLAAYLVRFTPQDF
ncbi:MAG: GAF domain-containing protein [candidate division NC10 bacterium]|nr:GAF domain-containing protein [candidate division NC10 bacterium]